MQLIPCNQPSGPLEPAPSTSLREAGAGRWEGFWALGDERYYTRCVRPDGREEWYRIDDIAAARRPARRGATMLAFPAAHHVPKVTVGQYRGRAMLVGRRARRDPAGRAR